MSGSHGPQKFSAEVLGTFVLVFFGVGTALATGADVITTGWRGGRRCSSKP